MSATTDPVAAWNKGCDAIRERERAGQPVPERWYERADELYREAAAAERAAAPAQPSLFRTNRYAHE